MIEENKQLLYNPLRLEVTRRSFYFIAKFCLTHVTMVSLDISTKQFKLNSDFLVGFFGDVNSC